MMDAGPGGRADSALELPRVVVLFFGAGGANLDGRSQLFLIESLSFAFADSDSALLSLVFSGTCEFFMSL